MPEAPVSATVDGPAPPPAGAPTGSPWISGGAGALVLVSVFLAILMGAMDGLVVSTVLPTIAGDLHQVNGVPFVVSGYLVASTVAIPLFARLSDTRSRRNVFLVGLAIFVVGSALAGLSQNLGELIAFRSMQGFGGGGIFPVAVAMVAVLYPPEARAKLVSVLTAAAGIAIVAGPLVGSYIVSVTTWRVVFYINLPFGLLAIAVLWLAVGPLRPVRAGGFDAPGAALLAGWVGALMVALIQVSEGGWAWTNPLVLALLGTAAVLVVAFVLWELRTEEPLVPLRLLAQRVMWSSSGVMLFTGVVFSGLVTFLSLFVGLVLGGNAAEVRDAIYFFALPMIFGAAFSGIILGRVAYRTVVAPGLLLAGVSALFLGGVGVATPLWRLSWGFLPTSGLVVPLIPTGFGLGLALAGATVAVQNEARPEEVGAAVGFTRFFQSLGGALGVSALTIYQTTTFDRLRQGATSPAQLVGALSSSFSDVFLVLAGCVLVAFACALGLRGRIRPTPTPKVASRPVPPEEAAPDP